MIGTVVPLLPGPLLIWGGAALWAWADGFTRVGWGTLIILAVLGVLAMLSDLLATVITGRKAGFGWRTIGGAIAGGLAGGILFSVLPVIGTLLGAILGALLGVTLVEYAQSHDWPQAIRAAKVYAVAYLLGRAVELVLCLAMLGIFAWAVLR